MTKTSDTFVDTSVDLLSRGHKVRFSAPGRSMHPTIREGETITIAPLDPTAVKKGDIILYRSSTGVIAHRVVRATQSPALGSHHSFLFRGDASEICDEPVLPEQILGRVVAVERHGHSINLCGWSAKGARAVHVCVCRLKLLTIRGFL